MVAWEIRKGSWSSEEEYLKLARMYWTHCLYTDNTVYDTDDINLTDSQIVQMVDKAIKYRDAFNTVMRIKWAYADMDVLDFGCGVGIDAVTLIDSGARVTLCDIILSNLWVAKRQLSARGLVASDYILIQKFSEIRELPQQDVIFADGSIHHIPPEFLDEVITNLKSILRPGGFIVAMTYTSLQTESMESFSEGPYTSGYTPTELKQLFGSDMYWGLYEQYNNGYFQKSVVNLTPTSEAVTN